MTLTERRVRLRVENRDGRWTATLDGPSSKNAVDEPVLEELRAALDAANDERAKMFVIRGAGHAFCAGADIISLAKGLPTERAGQAFRKLLASLQGTVDRIEAIEVPVVAAIDGVCMGGGLEIALACDVRIATPAARLGLPEVRIGLIPDLGGTQRLASFVGLGRARAMVLTGRSVTGEEALRNGLVDEVTEDLDAALDALDATWSATAPLAVGLGKRAVNVSRNADLATGLALEGAYQALLLTTDDYHEGIDAFLEKRTPQFSGR